MQLQRYDSNFINSKLQYMYIIIIMAITYCSHHSKSRYIDSSVTLDYNSSKRPIQLSDRQ